jgi:hypothetical protein
MLATEALTSTYHGSALLYSHETQFASAAEIIWLQDCSRSMQTSAEDVTELWTHTQTEHYYSKYFKHYSTQEQLNLPWNNQT